MVNTELLIHYYTLYFLLLLTTQNHFAGTQVTVACSLHFMFWRLLYSVTMLSH